MSSATTNTPPHLQNLLSKFDVERLGEGDLAAGATRPPVRVLTRRAMILRPLDGSPRPVSIDEELVISGTTLGLRVFDGRRVKMERETRPERR